MSAERSHSCNESHQWPSGSAFKTGKREVPASIPGRACRLGRAKFPVVFFETRANAGKYPLEIPPTESVPENFTVSAVPSIAHMNSNVMMYYTTFSGEGK